MLQITKNDSESLLTLQGYSQNEEMVEGLQDQEEVKASAEVVQVSQTNSKFSELELLQEELKGKIRASDPNIKEIVDKISVIQTSLS
jgi:predicted  nucleic acid-binding Zn-ribbon protein